MLGFKEFRNAAITIAGIELLHRIRKRQFGLGRLGVQGQLRLRSGTPFLALEVSTAQKGSVLLVTAICTKARCGTAPCPTVLASMLEDTAGHEIELLTGGSGMKRVLGPV
jgi:hypothetical protein